MGIVQPSFGYPGSLTVDPEKWAALQQTLGRHYMVASAAALYCTPIQNGTRQVQLAEGQFGGYGVLDRNDGPTGNAVVQLPIVASGTQWFLLAARRTWGATKQTSFVVLTGPVGNTAPTSIAAFPSRKNQPGIEDDQPLWLIPMTAGSSVPGTPIDVRLIGTDIGVYEAFSEFVLSYATWPGVEVIVNSTRRLRYGTNLQTLISQWFSASSGPTVNEDLQVYAPADFVTRGPEFTVTRAGLVTKCRRLRNWYEFTIGAMHDVSASNQRDQQRIVTVSSTSDNFPDTTICTLLPAFAPPEDLAAQCVYRGTTSPVDTTPALVGGTLIVRTDGRVQLVSGAAGYGIDLENTLSSGASFWSLKTKFAYFKGDTAA